jgi:amino acid adenylation domain-containing protein
MTLYRIFENNILSVLSNAEQTGVFCGERFVCYKRINSRANRIARFLLSLGVTENVPVGIYLKHNEDIPVAVLSVLKAGGCYVPLSTSFPEERIKHIISDSSCKIILTNTDLTISNGELNIININDILLFENFSDGNIDEVNTDDSSIAYILYTSGSTGTPKGVTITHGNMSYYIEWYLNNLYKKIRKHHHKGTDNRLPSLPFSSSLSFAAGVTQLYVPIVTGQSLHIIPPEVAQNSLQLFSWFDKYKNDSKNIYGLYLVPSLWEEHLRTAKENNITSLPEFLLLSGEPLREKLAEDTFAYYASINAATDNVWNLYGPTETVANITYSHVERGQAINIGNVLEGSEIILLNENNLPTTTDAGELCATGPGVTLYGYLNREDLNKTLFVEIEGKRYYKTGDYAAYQKNGTLKYLGRKDRQVKINGIRIELYEIENAFLKIDGVREAVALVMSRDEYEQVLIAFILSGGEVITESIKTLLPSYMLPHKTIILKEFPRLTNGKTDVQALLAMLQKKENEKEECIASCSIERKIAEIFSKVMDSNAGILKKDDNIFNAGAHSLTVIKIINRIQKIFNKALSIGDIYSHPTIRGISSLVKENIPSGLNIPYSDKNSVSLAINQKTLWLIEQTKNVEQTYNIMFSIYIEDTELTLEKIRNAVDKVAKDNDNLRSTIDKKGIPVRKILQRTSQIVESTLSDKAEQDIFLQKYNVNMLSGNTPAVNYILFNEHSGKFRFTVIIHHLFFDGYSINIFVKKLWEVLYEDKNDVSSNYQRFVQHQQNKDFSKGAEFWTEKIKSNDYMLNLPLDYMRPGKQLFRGDTVYSNISEEQKKKINTYCINKSITLFGFLITAYSILLQKYSSQKEVFVAFPYANRESIEDENCIGYFVNMVILRHCEREKDTFISLLQRNNEYLLESSKYWSIPLETYYSSLNVESTLSANPLYQAMFAMHASLFSKDTGKIRWQTEEHVVKGAKVDIFLEAQNLQNGMLFRWTFDKELFSKERVERFANDYLSIIDTVIKNDNALVNRFSLITKEELSLMDKWNNTANPLYIKDTVFALFEKAAKENPSKVALYCEKGTYTYSELLKITEKISHSLLRKGIRHSNYIGISIHPSLEMLAAILAVIRTGAAYVPLDPDYPESRINYIIENTSVQFIIKERDIKIEFPDSVSTIYMEELLTDVSILSETEHRMEKENSINISPEDILYVIYTSGTTGKPKGVPVKNKGVSNILQWMRDNYGIYSKERFFLQASISFDLSVLEMFLPLITGSAVVILPKARTATPDLILQEVKKYGVTFLEFVPSAWWGFLDMCKKFGTPSSLKSALSGGESMTGDLHSYFYELMPDIRLINQYGPTETTIYCTSHLCNKDEHQNIINIGVPVSNTRIYILDHCLNRLPTGAKGEIYIGGDMLAAHYINNQEENRKRFIILPEFNEEIYRTGDFGSFRKDGSIDLWGRNDDQVKIRGYRIELSEIESAIRHIEGIEKAIVLVRSALSQKSLIAFYTLKTDLSEERRQIIDRTFLRNSVSMNLPAYMIPSDFVYLKAFPTLPNKKIDKNTLLKNYADSINSMETILKENSMQGQSDIHRKLRLIWTKILEQNRFTNDDNFFEVGGHSLLILQLQEQIKNVLGKDIPLVDFYKHTSINSQVELFSKKQGNDFVRNIRERIAARKTIQT